MVIPAAAIAERRVADHFRKAEATAPSTAIRYEPTRRIRARALSRLKDAGVVRSATEGWYLDADAWSQRRAARRKRAAVVVGIAAVVGAVLAAL